MGMDSDQHADEIKTEFAQGFPMGTGSCLVIACYNWGTKDVCMAFKDKTPGKKKEPLRIVVLKAGDMVIFSGYLRMYCTHGVVRMQSETLKVLPTNLHALRKVITLRFKDLY